MPLLVWQSPKGSRVPCLIHLLGNERRMKIFRMGGFQISTKSGGAPSALNSWTCSRRRALLDKIKMLPKRADPGFSFFQKVREDRRPCKEAFAAKISPSWFDFPILKNSWPQDAGEFITWPRVCFTPQSGNREAQRGSSIACRCRRAHQPACHWATQKHGQNILSRRAPPANPNVANSTWASGPWRSDPMTLPRRHLPIPSRFFDEMMFAGFSLPVRRTPLGNGFSCKTWRIWEVPRIPKSFWKGYVDF